MTGQISDEAEPSAAWLVRAGQRGEREKRALAENVLIAGWRELGSIEHCTTREEIRSELNKTYPDVADNVLSNWTGQLLRFKEQIQVGDLVVMPLKTQPRSVAIARVSGPYRFEPGEPEGFRQMRDVEWLTKDLPRDAFKPDLRASIASLLTVCGLTRNDAGRRIASLAYQGTDPGVDGADEITSSAELLTDAAAQATDTPRRLTVRDLLAHWEETRRTGGTTAKIMADLADAGLTTSPPFTEVAMDDEVALVTAGGGADSAAELIRDTEDVTALVPSTLRIGSLPPAKLVSISPAMSLTQAKTLMLRLKFSQLAVIDHAGVCHGAVSWESIGKAHIASSDPRLSDATSSATIVDHDAHLLDQIDVIYQRDFVFVRNADRSEVSGIVTAADLTRQFGEFSRPFVLIEEVENRLRRRAGEVYVLDELRDAVQPQRRSKVHRVSDFSFGDYKFLIQTDERWPKLEWNVDRDLFVELLEEVRRTRNDLMHFTPDPLAPQQYAALDGLLELLRTVDPRL